MICKKNSACSECLLGSYLYIDVEDAYRTSTYARENNIDAKNLKTELDKLPTTLKIKNCTFILSGVVEFIPPRIDDGPLRRILSQTHRFLDTKG